MLTSAQKRQVEIALNNAKGKIFPLYNPRYKFRPVKIIERDGSIIGKIRNRLWQVSPGKEPKAVPYEAPEVCILQ